MLCFSRAALKVYSEMKSMVLLYTHWRGFRIAFERFVGFCIVLDFLYNAIILNGSSKYHALEFMGAKRVRIASWGF